MNKLFIACCTLAIILSMYIADKIDKKRIQSCIVNKKDEIQDARTQCFNQMGETALSYTHPNYIVNVCEQTSINNICR